jgi:formylglycine-generating enzyme required for sulfatase activity
LCKRYRISQERAQEIVQEVRKAWTKAHPTPLEQRTGDGTPPARPAQLPLIDPRDLARREQIRWAQLLNSETAWTSELGIRFRLIPPGQFRMGASPDDPTALSSEQPRQTIRIEHPFWAATFPLTNAVVRRFLEEVLPDDDSQASGLRKDRSFAPRCRHGEGAHDAPVVELSARDAEVLCAWLRRRDGRHYRLPTEAEWEYMARAGATGPYWWEEHALASRHAIFEAKGPASLDERRSNAWGLIDTLGNVMEWTSSAYEQPLDSGAATRPAESLGGNARAVRGGSWRDKGKQLRLSWRRSMFVDTRADDLGVRLVCELDQGSGSAV